MMNNFSYNVATYNIYKLINQRKNRTKQGPITSFC